MSSMLTRVEVSFPDGGRASLDLEGWHAADPRLLERLRREAPPIDTEPDPLDAAMRAARERLGADVILLKRRAHLGDGVVGAASKLYRALTTSALHRVITPGTGPDDAADAETGTDGATRAERSLWLLRTSLACLACALVLAAFAWLLG